MSFDRWLKHLRFARSGVHGSSRPGLVQQIIRIVLLALVVLPLCKVSAVESYTSYVPADDGAHHIYSSGNSSPVWRLNVGISNTHCEHDVGIQSPNNATWVLETATPSLCAWKCVVAGANMSELFFQQTFAGELICTNSASGGVSGGTNDNSWSISGERQDYDIIPEEVIIAVGQTTNFIAFADGDETHLINSEWSLTPTSGVTTIPSPLPDGSSVSFSIDTAGDYVLTGRAVGDPEASDTAIIHVEEFVLDMTPYLGVNMVDPINDPIDSYTASVTPDPSDATYIWSLLPTPSIATITPSDNTAIVKETGSASSSYQAETVKVNIPAPYSQTLQTNFTIVAVDIEMQGRDETNEETTGFFICYNDDDDNTNGVPDVNEMSVTNENDLVPLTITLDPYGLPTNGTVSLAASTGVELYEDPWKQTNALSSYFVSSFPLTLWAEGASVSTAVTDQFITASFDLRPNAQDKVRGTVIKVDLVPDYNRMA